MEYSLIFDMGGTAVKYALSDWHGAFLETGSFPPPAPDMQAMLKNMRRVYDHFRKDYEIAGIPISTPGAVCEKEGVVHGISAIPYIHDCVLAKEISEWLDKLPVSMENDANCAALGEYWKRKERSVTEAAFVICGTGIGGAYIQDGKILRGTTGYGCEFGYFPLGNPESGADGSFARKNWSDYTMVKAVGKYENDTGEEINGQKLAKLAEEGDARALAYVDEFCYYMAYGCYMIQYTLDPHAIFIGGGITGHLVTMTICARFLPLEGSRSLPAGSKASSHSNR